MSITGWDPQVGTELLARLDLVDASLARVEAILRTRTTPGLSHGVPTTSHAVLHALALADDAELACAATRRRLADLRTTTLAAAFAYAVAERVASDAVELAGGIVGAGIGALMPAGLLLALVGAAFAQTPAGSMLTGLAAQILAPLASTLPTLLNDPAFVDALALAIESADEALAGFVGPAHPMLPYLAQGTDDDEALSAVAGVTLAIALLIGGRGPRLPGQVPTRAVLAPEQPRAVPPVGSYAGAFERLTADGPPIEVQRYELPDGTVTWQVFARGTESFELDSPDTAYDLTANVENATNTQRGPLVGSAAAVEEALVAAGASPDDVVQLFGYSQGGAAVAAVAATERFRVETTLTFGAPIGATAVPSGATAVAVQNDSDLVSALGGRHGSDRIVLEASPDLAAIETDRYEDSMGVVPLAEVAVGGHHPEAYVDTAARLDASGDDLALAMWEEVGAATAGAVPAGATAYSVER